MFTPLKNSIGIFKTALLEYNTPQYFTSVDTIDISPVFIIGANRSGTSLVAELFAQHPDMEIMTDDPGKPGLDKSGHIEGYNESMYVWPHLFPMKEWKNMVDAGDGQLWGHPRNINQFYDNKPASPKNALFMANRLQQLRKTTKFPLLKDILNTLRIGFLCSIFSKARFVLVLRNYQDYANSCGHKWFQSQDHVQDITLHWLIINSVALHDLEAFAPGRFAIVTHEDLLAGEDSATGAMAQSCKELGLPSHDFDLSMIKKKYCYSSDGRKDEAGFALARKTGALATKK